MPTHEQEVKELFDQITVPIPGTSDIRAIKLDGFKIAIDKMMQKAHYLGQEQGLNRASTIIGEILNEA